MPEENKKVSEIIESFLTEIKSLYDKSDLETTKISLNQFMLIHTVSVLYGIAEVLPESLMIIKEYKDMVRMS